MALIRTNKDFFQTGAEKCGKVPSGAEKCRLVPRGYPWQGDLWSSFYKTVAVSAFGYPKWNETERFRSKTERHHLPSSQLCAATQPPVRRDTGAVAILAHRASPTPLGTHVTEIKKSNL